MAAGHAVVLMARGMPAWALAVLVGAGFHAVEHVVQAVQKYGMDGQHPHGLLGAWVDNDPMHFAYNLVFLLALVPLLRAGPRAGTRWTWGAFVGGTALQGVHLVEHTAKLAQWMAGASTARGILGQHFELIPLHLAINSAVYLLVAPHMLAWTLRLRASRAAAPPAALRAS